MRQQQSILWQCLACLILLSLCLFGPGTLPASAEVQVEASLSSLSFPQDRAARLTITITGTSRTADIALPEIDNIQLRSQGTSSQISMVNGDFSSSVMHNYLVQADKPGKYTIPPLKVTAGGESLTTQPIRFEVTPGGQQPGAYPTPTRQDGGQIAFIRISPTGSHYPGEIVPFTIKAYFNQAYRVEDIKPPTLRGDGVVMSQLSDQPQQTEESVKGRMYHVLTWETSLSGIKSGEHPISFSLDATLRIPQKRRVLSPFGGSGFFDDSFFNDPAIDSFFGSAERKPIVSVSPETVFTVMDLPTADQPENFTGAIGDFTLNVRATPVAVEVGEPITLTMEISGTGNFDRVEAPAFPENPDWKTYAPSAKFKDQGRSYTGTKIFEQAIVAKNAAATEIPPLSFSYFDPQQRRYITKTSKHLAVHIQKTAASAIASPVQPVPAATPAQSRPAAPASPAPGIGGGLAPIHLEAGSYHARIVPLFAKSWFLTLCAVCTLLLLTVFGLAIRRRNIEKNPEIERKKHKRLLLENDLKQIEGAQAAGDGPSFLALSKTAIQNQLGMLWNIEPAALSLADIKSRLSENTDLLEIFQAADEAAYGGASLTDEKMQEYFTTLKTKLEELS